MNNAIYRVTLDIHKTNSQVVFSFKKNDTARTILFCLTEGGRAYKIAENCTASFKAMKSDKTVLYNECTISENIIEYTLTNQTSNVSGRLDCELSLIGADGKQITSPRFTIVIENNVYDDSVIESTDEFTALQTAISAAANLDITVEGKTVTLTGKDGAKKVITLKDGVDGVSVVGVSVNAQNHLIVSFSNGTEADAGEIDVDTAVEEKMNPKLEPKQDKAITDEGGYYTSDTVEGALQELGEALDKFTYVSPTVTLAVGGANSTEELGKVLSSVTVSATANKECKSLKLYSGSTLLQSAENATSVSATVENVSTTTTFKAVATDKYDKNIQKTSTISFYNGIYYGVASDGVSISELTKKLQGNNNCEFSGNAGVGQYFFFASPKRYGTPSFKDKDTGFGADFTLVDGNVAFTNASGYEETYQLYRSTHPALGQTTITVY